MSRYPKGKEPTCPRCNRNIMKERTSGQCQQCSRKPGWFVHKPPIPVTRELLDDCKALSGTLPDADITADIRRILKRGVSLTVEAICSQLKETATQGHVLDGLLELRAGGYNVSQHGDTWAIDQTVPLSTSRVGVPTFEYLSRPDNTFVFGVSSDQHLCSKYAREDVLGDLYDWFAAREVDRVFNAGNWIDGEHPRLNKFEIDVRGMEPQIAYLVEHFPQRPDLQTFAIWGDDHEGWFAQRESVDVGRFAERMMCEAGRTDWIDLGFMEASVDLVNANTGKRTRLLVMHPGGGSSYAISYIPQKIVECVPLDAEALTPTGWKRREALSVGDTILGYDPTSDKCQWTSITTLHDGRGTTIKYENKQFRVRVTENHRWAMRLEHRAGPNPNSKTPAPYQRLTFAMGTIAEYRDSWKRARIVQAAKGPEGSGFECIDPAAFMVRPAAVSAVLSMTSPQRQAFILGLMYGEGSLARRPDLKGFGTPQFNQNPGPVNDAFKLACFLEGHALGSTTLVSKKINGDEKFCGRTSILRKRLRMVTSFREGEHREEQVWCPTTPLGTWVMRQGNTITITGNSMSGGEKPAVLLIGHYHKLSCNLVRNVWALQIGTGSDQSPFMRKRRLDAHVGGAIVTLTQDPETGAIPGCVYDQRQYFDRGYYNQRWTRGSAKPVKSDRSIINQG